MPTASKTPSSSRKRTIVNSKPTKKPLSNQEFKSAEIIHDSDDTDEGSHIQTPPKKVGGRITAYSTPKFPPIVKPIVSSLPAKFAPVVSNGDSTQKQKPDSSRTLIRDESESPSEQEEREHHGKNRLEHERNENGKGVEGDDDSRESIQGGSKTGSDSESSNESGNGRDIGDDNMSRSNHKTAAQYLNPISVRALTEFNRLRKHTASRKPISPYEPPLGFEPAPVPLRLSTSLSNIFSTTSLRNQQIWHITVPSAVPATSLAEISSQSTRRGELVLSHEGAEYVLVSDIQSPKTKSVLLMPSAETGEYKVTAFDIAKTFHFQQTTPNLAHGSDFISNGAANATRTYERAVRQQPDGLRMRYRPFGDVEDSTDQSGAEPSLERHEEAPRFRVPTGFGIPHSKRKRTHDVVDVNVESPVKKQKSRARIEPVTTAEDSSNKVRKDRTASPLISKQRNGHSGLELNNGQIPVKRHKSKAALDPSRSIRTTTLGSDLDNLESLSSPKKHKQLQKAQQNGLSTASSSQEHNTQINPKHDAKSQFSTKPQPDLYAKNPPTHTPTIKQPSTNESLKPPTTRPEPPPSQPPNPEKARKKHLNPTPNPQPITPTIRPSANPAPDLASRQQEKGKAHKHSSQKRVPAASTDLVRMVRETGPEAETAEERKARRKTERRRRREEGV